MLRLNLTTVGLVLALTHCGGASSAKGSDSDASGAEGGSRGGGQDGASTDGTVDDGPGADGASTDGPGADGTVSDDAATDGAMADGPSADATLGADADAAAGPCRSGAYVGKLLGEYTSHLTGIGIPIPMPGDVTMTLVQVGSAGTTCMLDGVSKDCSDLFALQDATVTGVADMTKVGDASVGGFPFFCTMSGALDCDARKLADGWIQCTYCIGPLSDAGECSLLNGVAGTTGVGGRFAGPTTAAYDASMVAFVMGTWNGAEALAGNDGGAPGPDGGPISAYLSDSGVYLGPNNYGGSGTWSAAHP